MPRRACHDMRLALKGEKTLAKRKPSGYWTRERCIESASAHVYVKDWLKVDPRAYRAAWKRGWLAECSAHMGEAKRPNGYWTHSRCMKSARKHQFRIDWKSADDAAYQAAKRNGWLSDCTDHMDEIKKPKGFRTLEKCKVSALQHQHLRDWKEADPTAHYTAKNRGWLDQCTAHMERLIKPNGYWTLDRLIKDAQKYSCAREWLQNSSAACGTAYRHPDPTVYERCSAHFETHQRPSDTVYIWATGDADHGDAIVKVGMTLWATGDRRIAQVASVHGYDPKVLARVHVGAENARSVERKLLAMGRDPKFSRLDGFREFRAMTDAQLQQALNVLRLAETSVPDRLADMR